MIEWIASSGLNYTPAMSLMEVQHSTAPYVQCSVSERNNNPFSQNRESN